MEVGLGRLVADGVAEHLDVRGEASHLAPLDPAPPAEALRRVPPILAILHQVDAVTGLVEGHRMHVDFPCTLVTEHEIRDRLAPDETEAGICERVSHRPDRVHPYDEVEVVVRSRLLAERRIDCPTAVEPRVDPGDVEAIEDLDDVHRQSSP